MLSFHYSLEGNSLFRELHSSVCHFCFHDDRTLSRDLLCVASYSCKVIEPVPIDIVPISVTAERNIHEGVHGWLLDLSVLVHGLPSIITEVITATTCVCSQSMNWSQ